MPLSANYSWVLIWLPLIPTLLFKRFGFFLMIGFYVEFQLIPNRAFSRKKMNYPLSTFISFLCSGVAVLTPVRMCLTSRWWFMSHSFLPFAKSSLLPALPIHLKLWRSDAGELAPRRQGVWHRFEKLCYKGGYQKRSC